MAPSVSTARGRCLGQKILAVWRAFSASVTALIGTSLCWIAARLYEREAILG
jgi:hypothetical protein